MTDIAALTGDTAYRKAIDSLWNNVVSKKMYVQGGIGAIPAGESFGANYELPNTTAYNETCAAVGDVYWNQRMFLLHGESRYIDILEKILYNGLISGVGLDGKSFFYTNAMQVHENSSNPDLETGRSGWFECSCCPTNLARFLPSLPGYIYAQQQQTVYINLFISGSASLQVNHKKVILRQENNYPWDGNLQFFIDPASPLAFPLSIRIPGWAGGQAMPTALYSFMNEVNTPAVITVNGKPAVYTMKNGYAILERTWKKGDVVAMNLPMPVQRVHANGLVSEDAGKVALQSGPIIYCAEAIDNAQQTSTILMPAGISFSKSWKKNLLNGVSILEAEVPAVHVINDGTAVTTTMQHFTAIPYYAWANRDKGEMDVWFPEKMKHIELMTK